MCAQSAGGQLTLKLLRVGLSVAKKTALHSRTCWNEQALFFSLFRHTNRFAHSKRLSSLTKVKRGAMVKTVDGFCDSRVLSSC